MIHPGPLPVKPPSLPFLPSLERTGELLCSCLGHCGGNESGGVSLFPGVSAYLAPTLDLYYLDFSVEALSGRHRMRAGILLLTGESVGTIRLFDAVNAVYAVDRWLRGSEHLRTDLGRLLAQIGERIDGECLECCEKEGGCGEQTAKIHPPQPSSTHEEERFSLPHVCIQV